MMLSSSRARSMRCYFSTKMISPRQAALYESSALDALKTIPDSILPSKNLVSAQRIQNLRYCRDSESLSMDVVTPSPVLSSHSAKWKEESRRVLLEKLPWLHTTAASSPTILLNEKVAPCRNWNLSTKSSLKLPTLSKVSNIIAVSSCKGGVGKSTVAVNLAMTLKKLGGRVGILDADIYGPSLPTMVSPVDPNVKRSATSNAVLPVDYDGVKCMSFGFVNQKAAPGAGGVGAAVMRGAMVSKLIDQLVLGTDWGELDYLVIDMPPGTGDIQMTLAQQVSIACAVIVSTPQKLSFIDVVKGIRMFDDMKIPTVAMVENMAHFDCIHGHRHYPFGKTFSDSNTLKDTLRISMPILEQLSAAGDSGVPIVMQDNCPEELSEAYENLSETVATEVLRLQQRSADAPSLFYDESRGVMVLRSFGEGSAKEKTFSSKDLRLACRCAACVEEFTGKSLVNPSTIPDDIKPTNVSQKGNYAFAVNWSDGHTSSLYTFDQLNQMLLQ